MITIYTTGPECARCQQLHKWLGKHLGVFIVADMSSPKIITELRTEGVFTCEAPILRSTGPGRDDWYLARDLFDGENLNIELLEHLLLGATR